MQLIKPLAFARATLKGLTVPARINILNRIKKRILNGRVKIFLNVEHRTLNVEHRMMKSLSLC